VKIVCDTNVLVAGLVAEGLCRDIVKRRLASVQLVTSRALLDELARVLRHKFDTDPDEVTFLQAYRDQATIVRPAALPRAVCRDRDDDKVLAAAIAGKADLIVTGTKTCSSLASTAESASCLRASLWNCSIAGAEGSAVRRADEYRCRLCPVGRYNQHMRRAPTALPGSPGRQTARTVLVSGVRQEELAHLGAPRGHGDARQVRDDARDLPSTRQRLP